MLDKKFARTLKPLVNSEQHTLLQTYVDYRIAQIQKNLEFANDMFELKKLQGQLQEMRMLQSLRDVVNRDAD